MAKKTKNPTEFNLRHATFVEFIAEENNDETWSVGNKKYKNYTDIPTEIVVGGIVFERVDAEEISMTDRNEIMLYYAPTAKGIKFRK
jgi:hypothetical protein